MNKITKITLIVIASVAILTVGVLGVMFYGFGMDPFDQSGWKQTEDGNHYYMDYHGEPMVDWQNIDGQWYYLDPANGGAMRTGWLDLNGSRYYLGTNGIRTTGWQTLSDGTYYLSPSTGAMATGWLQLPEGQYYLDENGRKVSGWLQLGDVRYYLGETGTATGWLELDGETFYLDSTGALVTGWMDTESGRCYLDPVTGAMVTGWLELEEGRYYLSAEGFLASGWTDTEEGRFYLDENGQTVTGWLETEEGSYYLDETGMMTVGWLEQDGIQYYFHENGIMATGQVTLDEVNYFFTADGHHILLVNKWNPVPEGYAPNLVSFRGWQMDASCYDALVAMFADLDAQGYYYKITSAYRTVGTQQYIWDNRYNRYIASGYSHEGALAQVALSVAVPGTSEHHLGLAIDIAGEGAQAWLAEHCWEYGFIVRYPDGKTELTGIIYEPWHYRYVGVELALELRDSGLCLEEYMALHTNAPIVEAPEEPIDESTEEIPEETTQLPAA